MHEPQSLGYYPLYYHQGCPVEYLIINPRDPVEVSKERLGPDILSGQIFKVLIPGDCWRCAHMLIESEQGASSDGCSLTSEAVAPRFDYADNQLATREEISSKFPHLWETVEAYIYDSK